MDLVITEENWDQKREDITKYQIDCFVIGNDWVGEFDELSEVCEVIYLERTPEISTTKIKSDIKSI